MAVEVVAVAAVEVVDYGCAVEAVGVGDYDGGITSNSGRRSNSSRSRMVAPEINTCATQSGGWAAVLPTCNQYLMMMMLMMRRPLGLAGRRPALA